jgi:NADPH:quinone reductase-like Zn-dependent oxidoreductase
MTRITGEIVIDAPADVVFDFAAGQRNEPALQRVQHLDPLVELIRAGKITTVIDRRFALSEVPAALCCLGEGHAKGKVVVTVGWLPAWPQRCSRRSPTR